MHIIMNAAGTIRRIANPDQIMGSSAYYLTQVCQGIEYNINGYSELSKKQPSFRHYIFIQETLLLVFRGLMGSPRAR